MGIVFSTNEELCKQSAFDLKQKIRRCQAQIRSKESEINTLLTELEEADTVHDKRFYITRIDNREKHITRLQEDILKFEKSKAEFEIMSQTAADWASIHNENAILRDMQKNKNSIQREQVFNDDFIDESKENIRSLPDEVLTEDDIAIRIKALKNKHNIQATKATAEREVIYTSI